ncbi:MAG: Modulator of FtsH protease HflC [Firmicutes bacterium ADurb.Bin182]|nr:MAG: Modulator of FtsH protease HflC [Firmicutes bacterium ADurb.Bin182]
MKKRIAQVLTVVILLSAVIIAGSSIYVVRENEYVSVVRFSKIIDTKDSPGLYFKTPFIDSIRVFPKAIIFYDIPPSEVLTADKQNMTVDSYVLWRIADPLKFFRTLGSIGVAEERLDNLTYNTLKNIMGTLAQSDIINEDDASERNDIYDGIATSVDAAAANYGIDIVDVKIKRFDLPAANEQAVYARMISERNQIAEKYAADGEYEASIIRNNVDKQVNIIVSNAQATSAKIEAEGEQEYMRMLADAYNTDDKRDFYEYMLALDALEASLDGQNKTVILGRDSLLAKLLIGPEQ